ncbi:histidinol-phosphatase [Schizosaccharomyces pombe]|uniref:Probable histidinol-phosphatase n=1 Tax=Schizosaccharomyces pombe (strain 972 / ATCC 24843) TaxID=284812 RepID=HIS9_SCHPO|nr:putative histidinol-phosphatase [Schizosaccharomyces pombe]O14059.1 RecName: Full=Probable histidinol-phosphatase; Short=HolPase [Schizosaccharomyces pombe 972h-]CAA20439.1 histidinol-phosphatase (predicted) [Schizosaccharomyces pombe]|eukprot:NP_001342748.1 putative histidinol-phosphatase [Schizosaccharomyces pombe]
MPISSHSHSGQFCLHAQGKLEDVIQEAIQQGFQSFSFTEHTPRDRVEDLYPEELHLQPEDLFKTFDEYVNEARRLKQNYGDQINILIGAETEYIRPESVELLKSLNTKYNLDYFVGSVHHVNSIPIDFSPELWQKALQHVGNNPEQLFIDYFEHQYDLMQRLHPLVIGHFDLICLFAPEDAKEVFKNSKSVWELIQRNIKYAVSYGGIFEINTSAFRKGWKTAYPQQRLLELMVEQGAQLTLSDDSHGPHQVGLNYHLAKSYLDKCGITSLCMIEKGPDGNGTVVKNVTVDNVWSKFVGTNGITNT